MADLDRELCHSTERQVDSDASVKILYVALRIYYRGAAGEPG
jgi:hypothetical protein